MRMEIAKLVRNKNTSLPPCLYPHACEGCLAWSRQQIKQSATLDKDKNLKSWNDRFGMKNSLLLSVYLVDRLQHADWKCSGKINLNPFCLISDLLSFFLPWPRWGPNVRPSTFVLRGCCGRYDRCRPEEWPASLSAWDWQRWQYIS